MLLDHVISNAPVIAGVFIASLGFTLIFSYLFQLRRQTQLFRADLSKVHRDFTMLNSAAIGMGQRIIVLEQRLKTLQKDKDAKPDEGSYAFSQAMQMIDQGADANTVASNCGLSQSEAALMQLMRKQQAEKTPSLA